MKTIRDSILKLVESDVPEEEIENIDSDIDLLQAEMDQRMAEISGEDEFADAVEKDELAGISDDEDAESITASRKNGVKYELRPLYNALREAGFSGASIFEFQQTLPEIQSKAKQIAEKIEEFRASVNPPIVSDLTGEGLANEIANSIVRVSIYFWFTYQIFQDSIRFSGKLNAQQATKFLKSDTSSYAKTVKAIVDSLPADLKEIVFSKSDKLTALARAGAKLESVIRNTIALVEAEDPALPGKHSIDLDSVNDELAIDYLYNFAFTKFISAYTQANVKNLSTIDENIFKWFADPYTINGRIAQAKKRASVVATDEVNPETGKPVEKVVRGVVEPKSFDGEDEEANALDKILPDKTEDPYSPEQVEVANAQSNTKDAQASFIFENDNFLIKYFNTYNFTSLVGEILDQLSNPEAAKLVYFDVPRREMVETDLFTFLKNQSDSFVDRIPVTVPVLTLDILTKTANLLITLPGEPIALTPEVYGQVAGVLVSTATETQKPWFSIKELPGRYKEYLRQYLKLDNLPNFEVNAGATLQGTTAKERIIDALKRDLLTADPSRVEVIKKVLSQLELTNDPVKINELAISAGLSRKSIENINRNDKEHGEAIAAARKGAKGEELELSKKIALALADKFAKFLDKTDPDKTLVYGGQSYPRKQLLNFVSSLSAEQLSSLWRDIETGSLPTAMGTPFMSLNNTAPGQKAIASLSSNIEKLINLKLGMTESVGVEVNTVSDVLEHAYIDFFSKQATPSLQKALLDIKKLGRFLVTVIKLFEMYSEYNKKGATVPHKYLNLTNEDLEQIEDLQTFFITGKNAKAYTAHGLRSDLRNSIIQPHLIERIIQAFNAKKDDPTLFSISNDPFIIDAFPKVADWLMTTIDPRGEFGFEKAINHFEKTEDINPLRILLHRHLDSIRSILQKGHSSSSILKAIEEIVRGTGSAVAKKEKAPEEPSAFINPLEGLF